MKTEAEEASEMLNEAVPDKVRLKWTLQQLGKQESYIHELEDTIKKLTEPSPEERKAIKKEAIYKQQNDRITKVNRELGKLRNDYDYLLSKYNTLLKQHESN